MKPTTLLRIAAVIAVLFAIGHTIGAPWTPTDGPPEKAVVASMKSVHFSFMGANRTYWDFFFGFGLQGSVFLLALALVLWQTANLAKPDARRVRPLILILLAAYAGIGVTCWMYFFAIPLVMSAVICVCLALAWRAAGREGATG